MTIKFANRVKVSTSTTGTGTLTLGSAVDGFQTFAQGGILNGESIRYTIINGNEWEVGTGVYSGTTMSRSYEESSTGSLLNLAGDSEVFITVASTDIENIEDTANNALPKAGGTMTGAITFAAGQAFDGRDVSADGSKLDGIESGATGDQTNAEIRAAVEAATDSNVFTDADHTKLDGIETNADVTDTTNVTAAGALMDSEVTNLAQVKAFDSSDYATAAQGITADAALPKAGGALTGAVTTNSTFDGRNVSADGTKLDGIEANATADQTGAEIKALYEAEANAYTDAKDTKLSGIETGATADQTASEIRALVESATDSNVFTDADHTKLNGIEASADITDTANVTAAGALMDSEVTDLDGIKSLTVPNNTTISTFGASLVDDADASAARTTLGLGTAATTASTNYATAAQGTKADNALPRTGGTMTGNIVMSGSQTVDGRDLSVDGAKLDGIEANATADQTAGEIEAIVNHDNLQGFVANEHIDWTASGAGTIHATNIPVVALTTVQTAANQTAHLALTAQEGDIVVRSDENKSYVHNGGIAGTMADYTELLTPTDAVLSVNGQTGAVTISNATTSTAGLMSSTDKTKLDGVETGADVTDATNVTAAGALMDSEVTNLAQVKAFDSSDYATAAQGSTADAALPKAGGTMTGAITFDASQTFDAADLTGTLPAIDGSNLTNVPAVSVYVNEATDTETDRNIIFASGAAGTANTQLQIKQDNGGITFNPFDKTLKVNNANFAGDIEVGFKIQHQNDSNTYISFTTDTTYLQAGGNTSINIDGINNNVEVNGDLHLGPTDEIIFDGVFNDGFETRLKTGTGEPTADRIVTLPDATGTLALDDVATTSADGLMSSSDKTKLDGIEANATADQTGAEIKALYEAEANAYTDTKDTKLSGIEASADVTDAANVTAAGALMDSEVTNLAQVKAFDSSDYATAAQGATADAALPKAGGTMTGDLTINEDGDSINLRSTTNAASVGISFSDHVTTGTQQIGHLRFQHADGSSYGSGALLKLGSSESTTTILADGKLMYDEGIYAKPASGTGAGTRKDANWDTAYTTANAALPKAGGTMTGVITFDASQTFDAADLTGTLPAIDGSNLTNVSASTIEVVESSDTNAYFPILFASNNNSGNVQKSVVQDKDGSFINLSFNPSTNKFLTNDIVLYGEIAFHGSTIDSNLTTLTVTDPTANRTITLPNATGTVALTSDIVTYSNATTSADGLMSSSDKTKLDGIEASATADQTAAEIRTLVEAATDSNVFTDADHTKLNGIEASADVTDTTNVTAAGALMDSELADIASVKALNQGVATSDSPTFAALTVDGHTLQNSTDRSGLLSLTTALGTWRGIQIEPTTTSKWSIMGDQDDFGLYDDENNEWIMLYNENSTLQLYANGSNTVTVNTNGLLLSTSKYIQFEGSTADSFETTLTVVDPTADRTITLPNATGTVALDDVATTSANGLMSSSDKTKLDGIESSATADQTAAEILTAIKTVDGSGSGLDADLLDGYHESTFMRKDGNSNLDMNNYNITNVNYITFNDPGPNEGIEWLGGNGWKIYESPDDLTTNGAGSLQFVTGSTRLMTIQTNGNVEIINDLYIPSQIIHTGDTDTYMEFHNANEWRVVTGGTERLEVTNSAITSAEPILAPYFEATSDINLKENIVKVESAVSKIQKLNGYTYNFKDEPEISKAGLIAQEVQEVLPEAVKLDRDNILRLDYNGTIALLVEAVKDQQKQIDQLTKRLN